MSREETVLSAERQVLDSENFLKQLISDDKTTGLLSRRIAVEPPPPAPIVVVDPVADFRIALDKRPDYQQAKLSLKRSEINSRLQFNQLLPRYVEVQVYRALLDSNAAFYAAQMTAMDTATRNSAEMIGSLTLYMNKVRQAAITREIIEVVSGAQAL